MVNDGSEKEGDLIENGDSETKVMDELDELPDLEIETVVKVKDCSSEQVKTVEIGSEILARTDEMKKTLDSVDGIAQVDNTETGNENVVEDKVTENTENENSADAVETMDNDLMFDWEKPASDNEMTADDCSKKDEDKTKIEDNTNDSNTKDSVFDPNDEDKENIDPNTSVDNSHSDDIEKPTTSHEPKTTPRNSASKKRKKIAALAGIDLDSEKPSLSGDLDDFICLEEEPEAPVHPGVQNLMERLTKHAKKKEHKKKKDTDIR